MQKMIVQYIYLSVYAFTIIINSEHWPIENL